MGLISGSNTIAGTLGPYRMEGVPVSGGSGSFLGAEKGARLVNTLTGIWYSNTGTTTSPTWTVIGSQT